jgi:hypothetical protein
LAERERLGFAERLQGNPSGMYSLNFVILSIPNLPYVRFIQLWQELITENPEWEKIIQPGLDKLDDYEQRLADTPVHMVAMGKLIKFIIFPLILLRLLQLLILQTSWNFIVKNQSQSILQQKLHF